MKAVIMAGGRGTRFWPASRERRPKQFLEIAGPRSMLQETVARLEPLLALDDIFVVCSQQYVQQVASHLNQLKEEQIIVEPLARNTAACVGLAASYLKQRFPQEILAVLPADHVIQDVQEFHHALRAGEELGKEGWLVTFGIEPSYPATGYGYVLQGAALGEFAGRAAYQVKQFTEKPDRPQAEQFLKEGSYYWNSGIFLWSAQSILAQIELLMPQLSRALADIERSWDDHDRLREIFSGLESTSIDFGVMEKSEKIAIVPCSPGWNDVGNWRALEEIRGSDSQGVTSNTPYLNIDSRDCLLYTSQGKLVALVGVENMVVVDTPDALLVCARDRTEEVQKVVEGLKEKDFKKYS
ncbi:sugar phosphate nucleotidyltransferase [Acidobacteria bacterium AH-259-D05]|nr:sugar phosphate nucleotidyltransferase [Acidobacteria bacterium AH-259-D05]